MGIKRRNDIRHSINKNRSSITMIDPKTTCDVEHGAFVLIADLDKSYKPSWDFDYSTYLYVRMVLSITLDDENASNNLIVRSVDRGQETQSAIISNAYNANWARQSLLNNLPSVVLQKGEPRIFEMTLANFQDDWALGSIFSYGSINIPYVQYFKTKSPNNIFRLYAADGFKIKGKIWGIRI